VYVKDVDAGVTEINFEPDPAHDCSPRTRSEINQQIPRSQEMILLGEASLFPLSIFMKKSTDVK